MPKTIKLGPHERVIAVTPERQAGPGWANAVTWVHIVDFATNKYRCEDIQPEDRTPALHELFEIGYAAHLALLGSISTKKVKA